MPPRQPPVHQAFGTGGNIIDPADATRNGRLRRQLAWASLGVFFSLLAIPFAVQVTDFDGGGATSENRVLASAPARPAGWPQWFALPRQMDAWLRDRFGFRAALVRANSQIRYALFHEAPTRQVLFGKHGRLFLSGADENHPYSIVAYLCGINVPAAQIEAAATGVRLLLHAAAADAPGALFVAVPSAPVLYAEDLPDWLARQCTSPSTVERVMQRVNADPALATRAIYPIEALLAAKRTGRAIPRYNFHWSGHGANAAATMLAGQVLGLRHGIDLPILQQMAASDLSNMVPGLDLNDRVSGIDYPAAGIAYCYARPECLPELDGSIATIIGDYSRTLSPRAGTRRLLMLTDSYGSFIAPWFAAWFGEVRHVSTNSLDRLSAGERTALREVLFRQYRPDTVIFLYHDGAVTVSPGRIAELLWPAATVASARR